MKYSNYKLDKKRTSARGVSLAPLRPDGGVRPVGGFPARMLGDVPSARPARAVDDDDAEAGVSAAIIARISERGVSFCFGGIATIESLPAGGARQKLSRPRG